MEARGVTRRRFLAGAVGLGAGFGALSASAACAGLPTWLGGPSRGAGLPLRHLVLLMQENRSFDHYFGRFPGADGIPPGAPVRPASSACQRDVPHDRWAFQEIAEAGKFRESAALTYYGEQDLTFYWALARRFALCDRYFASLLGGTFANRLFGVAASGGGYLDNPHQIDPARLPRPSIVDRLDEAKVAWACYVDHQPDAMYNPIAYYPERRADPRANRTYQDFLADAAAGRLPGVAWVISEEPLNEHPPHPPQWGERLAALTVHAIASSPQWPNAALVINYDESGGFYDHVQPPPVDGASRGFRVPALVVSPYARPGHISHVTYEHASVLALIERVFDLPSLGRRDAKAGWLEDCFDFDHPTHDPIAYPARLDGAACAGPPPAWAAELLAKPLPAAAPAGVAR
jgi:phospholipase C